MALPCQGGGVLLSRLGVAHDYGLWSLRPARLPPSTAMRLICRATSSSSDGPAPFHTTPYSVITGLAAAGLAESSFLAWTKVAQGAVACPLGGPGCSEVLNGDFAAVYGIPISMVGVGFHGAVSLLGVVRKPEQRTLLLGCTTAMAAASAYFIYIVGAEFEGASCNYCAVSALLSLGLLVASMRGVDTRQTLPMQVAVGASVLLALYVGFSQAETSAMMGSGGAASRSSASALETTLDL